EKNIEDQALFDKKKKIIITAGRLVKEKDHATLLQAFANFNMNENSHLIILGEGELEAELKSLAEKLEISERVSFIGFKQNPYAYIKRADVFTLTSTTEGFGHVLVEALALGLPVVSTRCNPGAEEILGEEKYGMLSEVGNPSKLTHNLERALTLTEDERAEMIAQGKKRANEFAAGRIVEHYEEVFMQTINEQ